MKEDRICVLNKRSSLVVSEVLYSSLDRAAVDPCTVKLGPASVSIIIVLEKSLCLFIKASEGDKHIHWSTVWRA